MKVTKIIGKKVLDNCANEIGKITDIEIDLIANDIKKVIITSSELSLKRDSYELSQDMILKVGDYVLLNVSKNEIEERNSSKAPDVEVVNPKDLEED